MQVSDEPYTVHVRPLGGCEMIDTETYFELARQDGKRIAEVAAGHLDDPVPSCPGNTVGSLLLHTANVCMFWAGALIQNREPTFDWKAFPTDVLEAHILMHERFLDELPQGDPEQPAWTWAGEGQTRRWYYRRAAQELAVHRWDFENAVGAPTPIDAELALDGIDELLFVFGPKTGEPDYPGASERFDGHGERLRLEATDLNKGLTIVAHPDHFETDDSPQADVAARGTASDLLLFLWGRVPASALDVNGDASLLDRWQDRVKI
jgi:uncharacterized protein (TIGR03083 family)